MGSRIEPCNGVHICMHKPQQGWYLGAWRLLKIEFVAEDAASCYVRLVILCTS